MSQNNSCLAEAINLPQSPATVLLPAQDLKAILAEVRGLRAEFDRFKKTHNDFAVRTTNEIDELFAKFEQEPTPGQKNRADILLALLAAHDGKMLAKEARQKMKVSKTIFSRLLSTMKDKIEIRPLHSNKKYNLLVLRSVKDG
jgi:hypothetical protein